MSEKKGLLSSGWSMVMRNKRYLVWFWLLNLTLAEFGTAGFRRAAHAIMDHSLYSGGLVRGFDLSVLGELFSRPEFGSMQAYSASAMWFAFVFFLFTTLFLPGVFQGYASTYRLPREDFFRACGRNLWRFLRLMIVAGIVMGIAAGILFGINSAIMKKSVESTNEVLPFELQMTGLAIIFLIMSTLRIWFDLAEADVVLNDQKAVRKSIGAALRHTLKGLLRLLGSYVVSTIVAAVFLIGGMWVWMKFVAPENVTGAFLIAQITLFLTLIPRFWQRGVAVTYWQQEMLEPVYIAPPSAPPAPVAAVPGPAPAAPAGSSADPGSGI